MSCIEEMPDLVKVAGESGFRDVDVLLVSYDLQVGGADPLQVLERLERFVRKRNWPFDVVLLKRESIDLFQERFELSGPIPVSLAIDAQGRVVDREEGESSAERFRQLLTKAHGR